MDRETREKLMRGEAIDLADPRVGYRESDDAFDMGTLFEGIDGKEGSFAAIHCNKTICYRLAKAANGGYQAIEEVAANRLREFASAWDRAADGRARVQAFLALSEDCFHKKTLGGGGIPDPEDAVVQQAMRDLIPDVGEGNGAEAVVQLFSLARKRPQWRLYRNELWRDAERAANEVATGRAETMAAATLSVRHRVSNSGRKMPKRTVSTPLLLKGLEFDHVVIPDATHFGNERQAQAKLFYVAISRATRTLTIASSQRFVQFNAPDL
ncbi:ATP-binding domain-containing protein [Aquincola sp. MAHUQ-54]|uniref:ATP-binding domain-containing protein n=1 Tax=Aquincola agrisoli TaxID=3119538 RepID=A0AAW9QIF4_9BURK